eukprot:GHRR01013458.1.p1 GENE.GHRR01013458.1~~GHRR01013458.1.p1  ORF type:complete len:497 (+),score=138.52 GHRR01013458.1:592-2082(+)
MQLHCSRWWFSWLLLLHIPHQLYRTNNRTHLLADASAIRATSGSMSADGASQVMPPYQTSVPAIYCLDGKSLEAGLCYTRCKFGWKGLACSCWKEGKSYSRGCGVKPLTCQAMSYRRQRLPAITSRNPFSLVLSADPQLFRVTNDYKNEPVAVPYNRMLVQSINRVTELQEWTWQAGGGVVQQPEALVLLGDMTEYFTEDEADAFRHFYDPSFPTDQPADQPAGQAAVSEQIQLPTWLMLGNHDYVNNVKDCGGQYKGTDSNICAIMAVDTMRSVLSPGCDDTTWRNFPRGNVTSFDVNSMAYSFDYSNYHFVVLQYSPRYSEPSLSIKGSMLWLAAELSAATAQQRRIVLLVHSHRDLGLAVDPTFSRLLANSNVVAIFYGHVHIRPWGMTGNYPNTNVPMFNCGASWYHVYCLAEFSEDRIRVAAVVHNATNGSSQPHWFGSSVHALLKQQRAKPVLQQFTLNPDPPNQSAVGMLYTSAQMMALMLAIAVAIAL